MVQINLKSIIRKNGTESLIHSIMHEIKAAAWIEDDSGKILAGEEGQDPPFSYPVKIEGRVIGYVKGDEHALIIANILDHLAIKEKEKKKLGAEVLNLYQEINMIFNFSEKLAQTIDATSICVIAFQEAMRVIESDNGVIILMNESTKKLQVKATSGESFFNEDVINAQLHFLLKIIWGIQSEIITDTSLLAEAGIILPEVNSIIYSALKVNHRIMGVIILGSKEEVNYTAADLKLLTTLALQSSSAMESAFLYEKNIKEVQEKEAAMRLINEVSGKFVPYEFIGALGHTVLTDVKLGDQVEKIVTVLFSDIRDYTTLSEQMTPEENFRFVCSFNERMGPAIRKHNGFINQYLGDAIMAIFPGNAADALCASIEMQKKVVEFNAERNENGQQPIQIGVGMHTGPLIMGITGDADRLDATTISDTVNTASRLESLTKQYKTGIILSEASLNQITQKEKFHLRSLGLVQLKGKQNHINIHECFSGNTEEDIFKKQKTLSTFNQGMYNYLNSSFGAAEQAFLSVAAVHPEDRTAEFFLNNSKLYMEKGIIENGAGI
ncbi:adenylate/guanylate cyclase domain-containing protein [Daejeonella sp.]|uniref:adenylate/guanylate cyclase domain-containing protein n=1 Tax=Daejeonella sp. TaxID=2805397 RepID=UPI00272F425E|nr:adenylate/guanylate cyclase domain-containing protein [Daejeonella sp.]MDP2412660.1 adenylate/guanylate cyclase domain-containing protein [Daejeonella sp.]